MSAAGRLDGRGRLLLTRCASCSTPRLPGAEECPACLSPECVEELAGGRGTLVSWVVYHRAYDPAFAERVPYEVVLVELDEGPRLLAGWSAAGGGPVVGARVRLVVARERGQRLARFALD